MQAHPWSPKRIPSPGRREGVASLLIIALAVLAWGCGESPTTVDPDVAGGGQIYVLSYDEYVQLVAPVLEAEGCHSPACHGGGIRGTFELSPASALDTRYDFEQAILQVDGEDPAASPLLTMPLQPSAGGAPHSVDAFETTDDPGYLAILTWIEDGEFQ
jgi:hypothetical protein